MAEETPPFFLEGGAGLGYGNRKKALMESKDFKKGFFRKIC